MFTHATKQVLGFRLYLEIRLRLTPLPNPNFSLTQLQIIKFRTLRYLTVTFKDRMYVRIVYMCMIAQRYNQSK